MAARSGDVCGVWTQARHRREAAVTRGRGRFWLGARMGPPPAPLGRGGTQAPALETPDAAKPKPATVLPQHPAIPPHAVGLWPDPLWAPVSLGHKTRQAIGWGHGASQGLWPSLGDCP